MNCRSFTLILENFCEKIKRIGAVVQRKDKSKKIDLRAIAFIF
jgi:hypothetical protein